MSMQKMQMEALLCSKAHWRHYYYNPSKNHIDCPRSGSITIADFGWISFNKKLQAQLFYTQREIQTY